MKTYLISESSYMFVKPARELKTSLTKSEYSRVFLKKQYSAIKIRFLGRPNFSHYYICSHKEHINVSNFLGMTKF